MFLGRYVVLYNMIIDLMLTLINVRGSSFPIGDCQRSSHCNGTRRNVTTIRPLITHLHDIIV